MRKRCPFNLKAHPATIFIMSVFCSFFIGLSNVFGQQGLDLSDNAYKLGILQKISNLLETKYVLPEKAAQFAEAFRKRYENGSYESFTDPKSFAEQVNADLVSITQDQHNHFRQIVSSDAGENPESTLHHPIRYHRLGIKENYGFHKLEWLDGHIGYLDIRRFYLYPDVKDRVIAAMQFLSNADAIIIDLRENGGGSGDYLSSYFLDHPTQLTSSFSREHNLLTEFWTSKDIGFERLTEVPLFLLISKKTFSASEAFAYDMKVRKRATLVGDSTRGGAHSVDLYQVDDHFEIYISTERAINPVVHAAVSEALNSHQSGYRWQLGRDRRCSGYCCSFCICAGYGNCFGPESR